MGRAATAYSTAHTKTAWIDTVNITITSLAANLNWPLHGTGGTLTGRVNPYQFKYDGWSSTGPSKITFPSLPGDAGWWMRETDSFTNKDFAALVYFLFGPAGWAACGFHFSTTAHFHHDVTASRLPQRQPRAIMERLEERCVLEPRPPQRVGRLRLGVVIYRSGLPGTRRRARTWQRAARLVGSSSVHGTSAATILTGTLYSSHGAKPVTRSSRDCITNRDPHSDDPMFRVVMTLGPARRWQVSYRLPRTAGRYGEDPAARTP
ncbi:MAG: hypothetical protein QOI48_1098 [Solirubrobacteraceae bacterium]|nr:hypothetical protein [Solirubrobacteraceae bacterium]